MESLASRLADGESDAFAELFSLCGNRLHHYLTLKLLSREDASDVLQEVFLRLVRAKESFRSVENVVAFAFKVARNEAARKVATSIRRRQLQPLTAMDLFEVPGPCEENNAELAEMLSAALSQLPEEQREVVVLKIYSGFVFREIAEITRSPLGTVATRYRLALETLREIVAEDLL